MGVIWWHEDCNCRGTEVSVLTILNVHFFETVFSFFFFFETVIKEDSQKFLHLVHNIGTKFLTI